MILPPRPASTMQSSMATTRRRERKEDNTIFGYEPPPDTPTLTRDVFKWVQSLDLSHSLRNVRRDCANGFIVAEIFSRYFPDDVRMHSFENGTSSTVRADNWGQLSRFCARQGILLPPELCEGSSAGIHGAAVALLEHLYETFTGKKVQRVGRNGGLDASLVPAVMPKGTGMMGNGNGLRAITAAPRFTATLEFGAVTTKPVTDAAALRRELAGRN